MAGNNWTREQILVAINLYCQIPFGRLHKGNPIIIKAAKLIGRTPDALAMKLTNLASLDPAITETGRKGLDGSSNLDKAIWAEFEENPDAIGYESQLLVDALAKQDQSVEPLSSETEPESLLPSYYAESTTARTQIRVDYELARSLDSNFIWTVVEAGDGNDYWITPGIRYVNRICYLVTAVPHADIEVEFRCPHRMTSLTPLGLKRQLNKLKRFYPAAIL